MSAETGLLLVLLGFLIGYGVRAWEHRAIERAEARDAERALAELLAAPGLQEPETPKVPEGIAADGCNPADHDLGVHSPWHLPEQWQGGESR